MLRILILTILFALPASVASAKVRIAASLPDLAAIAKAVGGDRVKVQALSSPSADPHYVDARPNLILVLNKADMLVIDGLQLEQAWLGSLVKQARNSKINKGAPGYFVAADYVQLRDVPTRQLDRAEGDIHPGGNPHFYNCPTDAIPIAQALRDRLSKIDPDGAATYAKNTDKFTRALVESAQSWAAKFAKLPKKRRQVVAYHASLGYLEDWLGLHEIGTVEPKPGIPPNPQHVAQLLGTLKSDNAHLIVQEDYYPSKTSATLAKLAKAKLVVIAGGTDVKNGETYLHRVNATAEKIYNALAK